ncbi:Cacna1h [Symbiodinium sp. KB8]|nr:Cacna1h [Symbiodinium sp. KB8]
MSSSVSFAAEGDFESPYVSPLIQPGHLLSCEEQEAMCAEQEIQTAECDFAADLASRLGEMLAQQHIQTCELMRQRHEEVMRAFSTQSDMLARVQMQKKVRIPLRRKDSEKSSGTSACRSGSPQVIVSSEDVATMVNYKLRSTSGSIGTGTDSDGFPQVSSTGDVMPLKAITEATEVKPDDEDSVAMPKELPATKKVRTISGRNATCLFVGLPIKSTNDEATVVLLRCCCYYDDNCRRPPRSISGYEDELSTLAVET